MSNKSEEPLHMLKELFKIDKDICKSVVEFLKLIQKTSKLRRIHPDGMKNIHIAGSITEGATVARLFSSNNEFESGVNQQVEVDLEYLSLIHI